MTTAHAALRRADKLLATDPPATAEALAAVLDAWRATRRPELADLVDRLCDRRAAEIEATRERTRWGRLPQVPALLRTTRAEDACWKVVRANLLVDEDAPIEPADEEELLGGADDPRLARAFFRVMFERDLLQGHIVRPAGVLEGLVQRFEALGDVRFAQPLAEMLALPSAFASKTAEGRARPLYARAAATLAEKAAALPPLDARTKAALDDVLARLPAVAEAPVETKKSARLVTRSAAEALAQVWEAPDDRGLREVCGDRLSELGDPRGEFIALSFAASRGKLDKASDARMKALYNKNAGHWAGALAPISTREGMRFELGFVSEISLHKSSLGLKREMWDDALLADEWATVKRVNVGDKCPDWWLRALLASPRSARLAELAFMEKYDKKPGALFARGAPGTPLRLASAGRARQRKVEKLVGAFSAPERALLLEDALRLEVSWLVAALATPEAKPKPAKAKHRA